MISRTITLLQPGRLVLGSGCLADALDYLRSLHFRRVHLVTSPSLAATAATFAPQLAEAVVTVDASVSREPTVEMFYASLASARAAQPDCIVALGGGSPLDLAKLLAAFVRSEQRVEDTFGIGLLHGRDCHLVCLPTTAGTGSEVSPNAILLDEAAHLKKGVVSAHLVPDATFIDPALGRTVPASVTASTGLDTLTHCVEAYTNKFAHPLIDVYALEGIRLCAQYLARAVRDGSDAEAREGMARASMLGGFCLGPVNTAAVHALAYPLGGEFHVAHGLSNAVLLPAVFRFNAEASPQRHAAVAIALGATPASSPLDTAIAGAQKLEQLTAACGLEIDLARLGVAREAVPAMAAAAMTVQRLLKNNPREMTQPDAEAIYFACFRS